MPRPDGQFPKGRTAAKVVRRNTKHPLLWVLYGIRADGSLSSARRDIHVHVLLKDFRQLAPGEDWSPPQPLPKPPRPIRAPAPRLPPWPPHRPSHREKQATVRAMVKARVEDALEELLQIYGKALDTKTIAEAVDIPYRRVSAALATLDEEGKLYLAPHANRWFVLRVGEELELPPLSEKQQRLFDTLCRYADVNWRVQASFKRLQDLSGLSGGGMVALVYALEKKGHVAVIDRGNHLSAATYEILEPYRPAPAQAT